MQKAISIFIVSALLLMAVVPVFAQDEVAPLATCSDEELTATVEGLQAVDDSFRELVAEFDLTSDPTSMEYGTSLVALEAVSASFWGEFYPAVPVCAESQAIAFTVGSIYDQYLTVALLANLASWVATAGDEETAGIIAEQVNARLEAIEELNGEIGSMTFEELAMELLAEDVPACTEEELTAASDAMTSALDEAATMAGEAGDPLETVAVTEETAFGFWFEGAYDELAVCAEGQQVGFQIGVVLNDINIIAALYANAAAESEGGNAEIADVLLAAAQNRESMMAEMMGE